MTDRHAGYLVVLNADLRDDDAAPTVAALLQIKGVLAVEPVVASAAVQIAESRARHALLKSLFELAVQSEPPGARRGGGEAGDANGC
jgi:hypothetical protein